MSSKYNIHDRSKYRKKTLSKYRDPTDVRHSRQKNKLQKKKEERLSHLEKRRNIGLEQDYIDEEQRDILLGRLDDIIEGFNSNNEKDHFETLEQIRKLLSCECDPPIKQVVEKGVCLQIIKYLGHENDDFKLEACWILINILSGINQKQTIEFIKHGMIDYLLNILQHSENDELKRLAVWAFGNIAGDSNEIRNFLIERNVTQMILELLDTSSIKLLQQCAWCISNLCRNFHVIKNKKILVVLEYIPSLVYNTDVDIIIDTAWALSYITDYGIEYCSLVVKTGVVKKIIDLLTHSNFYVKAPCLRIIGNIVSGDNGLIQACINCGVLPNLYNLLHSSRRNIIREACWAISNIAAGSFYQIEAIINANIVPLLINLLYQEVAIIKREVVYIFLNICSEKNPNQIAYLVGQGVIKPFCELLLHRDLKLVELSLESLEYILYVGEQTSNDNNENKYAYFITIIEGEKNLEELSYDCKSEAIAEKAHNLLEIYFDKGITHNINNDHNPQNDNINNIMPGTSNNAFVFGSNTNNNNNQQFNFDNNNNYLNNNIQNQDDNFEFIVPDDDFNDNNSDFNNF